MVTLQMRTQGIRGGKGSDPLGATPLLMAAGLLSLGSYLHGGSFHGLWPLLVFLGRSMIRPPRLDGQMLLFSGTSALDVTTRETNSK